MMEAAGSTETSAYFYQVTRYHKPVLTRHSA